MIQAANTARPARATTAPRLTTAERRVLLGSRKRRRQADAAADDAKFSTRSGNGRTFTIHVCASLPRAPTPQIWSRVPAMLRECA